MFNFYVPCTGVVYRFNRAGKKGYDYLKNKKAKIENEPTLKEEFNKMIDEELAKEETE